MNKGFLKSGIAVASFQVASRGLSFLAFVLLARILGVEEIGNFAYIISLCALLNLFVEFGTNQFLIKEVASGDESKLGPTILNIILLKIVQFIAGIGLLAILEYRSLVSDFNILNLTIFYVVFEGIAQVGISILNGRKEFVKANSFIFFYEITRSVLLLGIVFITGDLKFVPAIYIFSAFLYAAIVFGKILNQHFKYGLVSSIPAKRRFPFLKYYRKTYLFFISAIAYQLYFRIDLILLKKLADPVQLGIYSTAYKFFEVFLFVPAIISGMIFPHVVSLYYKKEIGEMKEYLKRMQMQAVIIISALVLLIIMFSDLIISIFFGSSFASSAPVMQILFLTSFLYGFNFIYPVIFNSTGNERSVFFVLCIGFVLNFIFNYLFIPVYGAKASALITLLSECVVTILYFNFLKKRSLSVISTKAVLLTLSCILLSGFRILAIDMVGLIPTGLIVFSVFAFILVVFFRKEISTYSLSNAT